MTDQCSCMLCVARRAKIDKEMMTPASPDLDEIKKSFKLCLLEIVPNDFGHHIRFAFEGKMDDGETLHAGESDYVLENEANAMAFSGALRDIADNLDAYWERTFPSAVKK